MTEQDLPIQNRKDEPTLFEERSIAFSDFANRYYGYTGEYEPGFETERIIRHIAPDKLFVISDCEDQTSNRGAAHSIARTYFLYNSQLHKFEKSHEYSVRTRDVWTGTGHEVEIFRQGEDSSKFDTLRLKDSNKSTLFCKNNKNTIYVHREDGYLNGIQLNFNKSSVMINEIDLYKLSKNPEDAIAYLKKWKQQTEWLQWVRKFQVAFDSSSISLDIQYGDISESLQVLLDIDMQDVSRKLDDSQVWIDTQDPDNSVDIPWKNADYRKLFGVNWNMHDRAQEIITNLDLARIRLSLLKAKQPNSA